MRKESKIALILAVALVFLFGVWLWARLEGQKNLNEQSVTRANKRIGVEQQLNELTESSAIRQAFERRREYERKNRPSEVLISELELRTCDPLEEKCQIILAKIMTRPDLKEAIMKAQKYLVTIYVDDRFVVDEGFVRIDHRAAPADIIRFLVGPPGVKSK